MRIILDVLIVLGLVAAEREIFKIQDEHRQMQRKLRHIQESDAVMAEITLEILREQRIRIKEQYEETLNKIREVQDEEEQCEQV